MPVKRHRDGSPVVGTSVSGTNDATVKPMSAIAAARLKRQQLEAAAIAPPVIPSSPIEAASDPSELEEEVAEEIEETFKPKRNMQLCTWRYGKDYVSSESDEQLTVSLNKNTTITLIGCFDFTVLKGAVNINGANFGARSRRSQGPSTRRAFVPSTHPIYVIRGLDSENEVQFRNCDEPTAFAGLSPLFANIWNAGSGKGRPRSFSLITETDADPLKRSIAPELVPEDWTRAIEECANTSTTTLITGASSSGKSTFAQRLLNRYLTGLGKSAQPLSSVFYLDLDPSKPAYSPHGQISLVQVHTVDLGPSFTFPSAIPKITPDGENELVRAHAMPLNGISHYQEHLLACAEDLMRTFLIHRQRNPTATLIINIPGTLYTTAFPTLLQLLRQFKPQRVIHLTDLTSPPDEDTINKVATLESTARKTSGTLTQISSQTDPNTPSRTDSQLRAMHMQSYFHCTGPSKPSKPELPRHCRFSSKPLSYERPWEFCYQETRQSQQDFIGFLMLSEWVSGSEILKTLNGSLIQIMETHDPAIQDSLTTLPRTPKYRIPYFEKGVSGATEPLNPKTSRLICTALVRGWDPERKVVQIVVPKTHEHLLEGLKAEKTVFLSGCCETPEWAYTEDAYYEVAKQVKSGNVDERTAVQGVTLPPWVARGEVLDNMGYMNTARRIRKFQQ